MAEKKGLIQEFKEFLTTGDLLSVAVAFIMGAAVKAVIDSFVSNLFLGLVSILLPKSVSSLSALTAGPVKAIPVDPSKPAEGENIKEFARPLRYGQFIDDVIKFVTLAFVVFMIVRAASKVMKKKEEAAGPSTNDLLAEIRDSLKAGR
jgi:large conductance mechanosensitive channel